MVSYTTFWLCTFVVAAHKSQKQNEPQHQGADIFVVGTGKSLDYIAEDFFNKKDVTIGITRDKFNLTYTVDEIMPNAKPTMNGAIQTAALMGAARIFLVGNDAGALDGEKHLSGTKRTSSSQDEEEVEDIVDLDLVKSLRSRFNVHIQSINAFINLGLEGHDFVPYTY